MTKNEHIAYTPCVYVCVLPLLVYSEVFLKVKILTRIDVGTFQNNFKK